MTDPIVPPAARRAAKRAFVRTTAQAYAASIPSVITVGAVGDAFEDPVKAGITIGVGVLSPVLAGLVAFFQWLSKGIPEDYAEVASLP